MRSCLIALFLLIFWKHSHGSEFNLFEAEGKFGLKNNQGLVVLPPKFEALGWSDGSFSVVGEITGYKLNGAWGLINLNKEYITSAEYESMVFSGASQVIAIKIVNGIYRKSGVLTLDGHITIPFQYDAIALHGLRAVVMNKTGMHYRFGLVDLENRMLLPLQFNNIYPVSPLRFAVENTEGKLALFTDNGKPVTEHFIDSISSFYRDFAIIFSDGLQGVMDREGNVIAKPTYSKIELRDEGLIRALLPDRWKIITADNEEKKSLEAENLQPFAEHYKITKAGKHGLIDTDFNEVWSANYEAIGSALKGYIPVQIKNKWGLVDINKNEIIPIIYDSLVWDGRFAFGSNGYSGKIQWTFLNVKGNGSSTKKYDHIIKLNTDYLKVKKNGYSGLIGQDGKEIIHCVYDSIIEIRGNRIAVAFHKQFGIISTHEEWLLAPQNYFVKPINDSLYFECQSKVTYIKSLTGNIIYFSENPLKAMPDYVQETFSDSSIKKIGFDGLEISNKENFSLEPRIPNQKLSQTLNRLQLFQSQGKFGFRDNRGKLLIPNRYDSLKPFSDGLAAFKLLGKWGYLDEEDKITINPAFDYAGEFINGYAIVAKNKKYGLIDSEAKLKLLLKYDSIHLVHDKRFLYSSKKVGLASVDGKLLLETRYDDVQVMKNGQLLVRLDNKLGVLSSDGLNIIPIMYSSMEYDETKNLYLAHMKSEWITLELKH